MQKIADEGLVFDDFHAGASVCTPSRAAREAFTWLADSKHACAPRLAVTSRAKSPLRCASAVLSETHLGIWVASEPRLAADVSPPLPHPCVFLSLCCSRAPRAADRRHPQLQSAVRRRPSPPRDDAGGDVQGRRIQDGERWHCRTGPFRGAPSKPHDRQSSPPRPTAGDAREVVSGVRSPSGGRAVHAATAPLDARALDCRRLPPLSRRRHLGADAPFHPSFRGFDEYHGLPYSNDMVSRGGGRPTAAQPDAWCRAQHRPSSPGLALSSAGLHQHAGL